MSSPTTTDAATSRLYADDDPALLAAKGKAYLLYEFERMFSQTEYEQLLLESTSLDQVVHRIRETVNPRWRRRQRFANKECYRPRLGDKLTIRVGSDSYGQVVVAVTEDKRGNVVRFKTDRHGDAFVLLRSGVWVRDDEFKHNRKHRIQPVWGYAHTSLDPCF